MQPNSEENPIQRIMDEFDKAAAKGPKATKEKVRAFNNGCKATRESLKRERERDKLVAKMMKENRRRSSNYLVEKCKEQSAKIDRPCPKI